MSRNEPNVYLSKSISSAIEIIEKAYDVKNENKNFIYSVIIDLEDNEYKESLFLVGKIIEKTNMIFIIVYTKKANESLKIRIN